MGSLLGEKLGLFGQLSRKLLGLKEAIRVWPWFLMWLFWKAPGVGAGPGVSFQWGWLVQGGFITALAWEKALLDKYAGLGNISLNWPSPFPGLVVSPSSYHVGPV